MTSYFIGIDPGVNGAVAAMHGDDIYVWDIPTLSAEGSKSRRIIDGPALIRLLRKLSRPGLTAVLEEVRSMPRDGHVGAFAFGRSYGIIETALAATSIPFRTVRPQVWKKALGVLADKDQARQRATQLIPGGAKFWPLKKHDGRAEAALIGLYGRQHSL